MGALQNGYDITLDPLGRLNGSTCLDRTQRREHGGAINRRDGQLPDCGKNVLLQAASHTKCICRGPERLLIGKPFASHELEGAVGIIDVRPVTA